MQPSTIQTYATGPYAAPRMAPKMGPRPAMLRNWMMNILQGFISL